MQLRAFSLLAAAAAAAAETIELADFSLAAEEDLPVAERDGVALTAPSFSPSGAAWTAATVPCTVFACLMQAGIIPADVFVGSNIDNVDAKRFNGAWWYWTNFSLPPSTASASFASLALHGVNYRADLFLNGVLVADNTTIVGAYTYHEFDVTGTAALGANNRLAIRVTPQHDLSLGPGSEKTIDLGITFVDWSYHDAPDFNLGLWRKVFVSVHGPATLRSPAVQTALPPPSAAVAATAAAPLAFTYADLTVVVEARNYAAAAPLAGTLTGAVLPPGGGAPLCTFSVPVSVPAAAEATLTVTRADAPCLRVATPALWWPWQMGAPTLHALNLSLAAAAGDGAESDALATRFGIRTATSNLTAGSSLRQFYFNTLPVLVRGGGWSPDLFQRVDAARLNRQLALTRDLGLNAIRFEGKLEPDELYEALDALGILALPGWCCCDAWQHWGDWGAEQRVVAALSMRAQARRLRRFASMLGFLISSDELPPPEVEQLYLDELGNASWSAFAGSVSAASAATSPITGDTGVKMTGPYSWVPPHYWLEDSGQYGIGGAWGFFTEGGPGETPMTLQSLAATLPANASVWPPTPNDAWGKAGNPIGNFGGLARFNTPLQARYGASDSAADYLAKAAAASIEGHRAFMEGYGIRKYANATGAIQWMLNNDGEWCCGAHAPSNIWHFFHHDLTVGSAGAAAKQALAPPLHIAYDYVTRGAVLVNNEYVAAPAGAALAAAVEVFSLADETLFSASVPVPAGSVAADGVLALPALRPPPPAAGSGAFFLRLTLKSTGGAVVDTNTYWLPEAPDVIDWAKSTWYNTPCTSYADLTALFSSPALGPPRAVAVSAAFAAAAPADLASAGARWLAGQVGGEGSWTRATVTVTNTGPAGGIAFLVRLRVVPTAAAAASERGASVAAGTPDPAPVFWGDNYLTLRAGETRVVVAEFADAVLGGAEPAIDWDFGGGGGGQ